jgi:hypothetical protein
MRYLFVLLFSLFSATLFATENEIGINLSKQELGDKKKFDKTRLLFGGGIGVGGVGNAFSFNIQPMVGYRFTDKFHAGITLGFTYFTQQIEYNNLLSGVPEIYKSKSSIISASMYARYFVWDMLFAQVEPEINSYDVGELYYSTTTGKLLKAPSRLAIPSFLAGVGYGSRLGGISYMTIIVMYDLVQNPNSPYYKVPVIRGGLNLGLFNN